MIFDLKDLLLPLFGLKAKLLPTIAGVTLSFFTVSRKSLNVSFKVPLFRNVRIFLLAIKG